MSYMYQEEGFTLLVIRDEYAISPRLEQEPFSTIHTWGQGTEIGEKTSIDFPDVFLMEKVWDMEAPEKTVESAKQGEFRDIKLKQNPKNLSWELTYFDYHLRKNHTEIFDVSITTTELEFEILQNMWSEDSYKIASESNIIMPVNYKDGEFSTTVTEIPWGEDQVGFIFATHEEVVEKFGTVKEETIKLAQDLIQKEMCDYNHFHKGNVFSYMLYDGCEEIAVGNGFLGNEQEIFVKMKEVLPDIGKDLVENLEYVDLNVVENFIYQQRLLQSEEDR